MEINLIRVEKPNGTTELRTTSFEAFEYGQWYTEQVRDGKRYEESVDRRNEAVKLTAIRSELLRKATQYLEELHEINPKLLGNKRISELAELVSCLRMVEIK